MKKTFTALSLGSNLGERKNYIDTMERELSLVLTDISSSPIMETAPVGVSDEHAPYLNKIIAGYFHGDDPYKLLAACQSIEKKLGRDCKNLKAPRTADIDILLFGDVIVNNADLTIPHPEILNRRFCIEGLMAIDPEIKINAKNGDLPIRRLYKNMSANVRAQNVSFI